MRPDFAFQKNNQPTYMQHEVTNSRDPICNIELPMVGTLYATRSYQQSGPYMQHEVTNGRDLICNKKLPTVGTLYAT